MLDTAFILAAGLGTRMRPLTDNTAKPLLHYRGERLIERHLRNLANSGFKRVVINTCWHGQQLRQIIGDGSRFGISALYSCESNGPLETASGLARAGDLLGSAPFLLVNGDIWTDFNFATLRPISTFPYIILVDNPPHHPTGDFSLDSNLHVTRSGKEMLTYAGIGVYSAAYVKESCEIGSKLGDQLRVSAQQGLLKGAYHPGKWHDIGTPSALKDQH